MVSSKETTPAAYLASLPADRRKVIAAVRDVIRKRLPKGYEESMGYGMLTYSVPLKRYPDTHNKEPLMYFALAAQKNNYALYMTCGASDKPLMARLAAAYKANGKKPDMGKSCLRFASLEELPMDVIGDIVAAYPIEKRIASYEATMTTKKTVRARKK